MSAYLTEQEFRDLGLPAVAVEDVSPTVIASAIVAASGIADSYLAKRFTLPISEPGDAVRRHVADLVAYDLLSRRGFNPASGADQIVVDRAVACREWFEMIAEGKVEPAGLADATPDEDEAGPEVLSDTKAGWELPTVAGET